MIYPVIMAGGTGTRFWPRSRSRFPKQFLDFNQDESMLQATFRRLSHLVPSEQIYVVTNKRYSGQVVSQLDSLEPENLIVEPMRRDTASCIGLAAAWLDRRRGDGVMVIVPSDHHIALEDQFRDTLQAAVRAAENSNCIVTLGITPTEPKTGYGYIQTGAPQEVSGVRAFQAKTFTEKPDLERACRYLASGEFLWNSGIFVCRIGVILEAIGVHMPKLARTLDRIGKFLGTPEQDREVRRCYRDMEKVSIDFGIMEKAENILVLPCSFGWDDVGSWSVLGKMLPKDNQGNAVQGMHVGIDTRDCIVVGGDSKLVATLGVDNLIVVQTRDVVLICRRDRDQEVKDLVKLVKLPELRRFW